MQQYRITKEEIFEAADAILSEGQEPTGERLRLKLGSRGSFATIYKYFNEWKQGRLNSSKDLPTRQNLSLPDALTKAVANLLEKIRAESEAENTQIREAAERTVAQITEENSTLQEKLTAVQTNLQETQLALNHLQANYQLAQEALIDERKKTAVLTERSNHHEKLVQKTQEEADKRLAEINHSHTQIVEYLKDELNSLKKYYQEELSKLKEISEKQRQKYIVEIDQLKVAKEKAETSYLKLAAESAQQKKQNDSLLEKVKDLEIHLKVFDQENQKLQRDYHEKEKQIVSLTAEMNQKDVMMKDLKEQISMLTQKLVPKSEKSK